MELKRDEIIKALECCRTNSEMDCSDCHYRNKGNDLYAGCVNTLLVDALSLIKELTEENERVRGCVKSKEEVEAIMRATYEPLVKEITKEQIDKALADTVRKMQTLIAKESSWFVTKSNGIVTKRTYQITEDALDKIAKEMLEGV